MHLISLIDAALKARNSFFDHEHLNAYRLFNGFLEGDPNLVVELYARTLLIYNFSDPPEKEKAQISAVYNYFLEIFPWINAVVIKTRFAQEISSRHGTLVYGEKPDNWISEQGVRYAINLTLTHDSTFFLDTRLLRSWAISNSRGLRVLNTFAYTGSLGVASKFGGADIVVHIDQANKFLDVAKESYRLNNFEIRSKDFICQDFFSFTRRLRKEKFKFDIIFLDPPFFSISKKGRVDLNSQYTNLINKVRPLISDGGRLVTINNALFVSGREFMSQLENLTKDGFLCIETIIPIPLDYTGYPETISGSLPVDPFPFSHATKIAVLKAC